MDPNKARPIKTIRSDEVGCSRGAVPSAIESVSNVTPPIWGAKMLLPCSVEKGRGLVDKRFNKSTQATGIKTGVTNFVWQRSVEEEVVF